MRREGAKEKWGFQISLVLAGDGNIRLESVVSEKERVTKTNVDYLVCSLFLPY
jgi:hypothetical protein